MKDKIDAEKVTQHIQYTRHWLEKAEQDFQEKRFANGSVILNLARAELTAAWEEAMQLKNRIVSNIPSKKQNYNWKSVSSVSLLASGFVIAVVLIQFTSNPIPRTEQQIQRRPAISENASIAEVTAPAAPVVSAPVPTATITESKPSEEGRSEARRRYYGIQARIKRAIGATVTPPQPVVAQPQPQPQPVVATPTPVAAPVETPKPDLKHNDVIELYRTAEKALND